MGYFRTEFPRYQYQRLRWERQGVSNIPLMMQVEALVQGFANMSFLAFPAFLIASNTGGGIHALEIVGLLLWVGAFAMESVADMQKLAFLREMKQRGLKNQVCNVGLWRYSRHPNYFAEWMVWNALVIAAVPSWLARYGQDNIAVWVLLGLGLVNVSRLMYITLVHYTGAKPAEYFSVRKRPDYKAYQQTTNRFFPGPVKSGGGNTDA
jgi:steroid 5-alpha reductase family enzyme